MNDIRVVFNNENSVVPTAFNSIDVFNDAPSLYDENQIRFQFCTSQHVFQKGHQRAVPEHIEAFSGKLMIDHKWLEEPPQMDDRSQLINSK